MQKLRKIFARFAFVLAAAACFFALSVAYPDPLFAFEHRDGDLTILADETIDPDGAQRILADVRKRLDASPLPLDGRPYRVISMNGTALRLWYFAGNWAAGGIVYNELSRNHTFLNGANFRTDRMHRPSGVILPPPRTVVYFAAHEIAHILTRRRTGGLRMLTMPEWVREGIADYCALGPVKNLAALRHELHGKTLGVEDWNAHGYYISYRMLVTHFLDREGWSVDQLLASDISQAEAQRAMDARLAGGV